MASSEFVEETYHNLSSDRKKRKYKRKKSINDHSKSFKKKGKVKSKGKKRRSFDEKIKRSRKVPALSHETVKKFKDLTTVDHACFYEQAMFLLYVKRIFERSDQKKLIDEGKKMQVFLMVFYSTESNCIVEAKAMNKLAKQFDRLRLKQGAHYSMHYADLEIYKARKYLKILPNTQLVKLDGPATRPDFSSLLENKNFACCLPNFSHILSAPEKRHPQMQVCFLFYV